ncbi:MAG: GDYXXLXY domain-containing protein [Flavobacteriaceae bacterium]|nr:GDYXXLXY domain-containing protein [Flavobacteriaceae bacterium]
MNKLLITIGFFIMLAAQWFVPGKMISDQKNALTNGTPYKFRTQPIDPNDPFRGKYVRLNYEVDNVNTTDSVWGYKEPVYVYIKTGTDGYVEATEVSKILLDTNQDYVKADAGYYYNKKMHFDLPFNRFYMEESKALDAEKAIRVTRFSQDSLAPVCYALVYVKGNIAVLDNVFVGDVSIKEFVEQEQKDTVTKRK